MTYQGWLKRERERAHLSQEKLGMLAGLGRTYINKIENEKIALPNYETRQKIHDVLGTSEQELKDLGIVHDRGAAYNVTAAVVAASQQDPRIRETLAAVELLPPAGQQLVVDYVKALLTAEATKGEYGHLTPQSIRLLRQVLDEAENAAAEPAEDKQIATITGTDGKQYLGPVMENVRRKRAAGE